MVALFLRHQIDEIREAQVDHLVVADDPKVDRRLAGLQQPADAVSAQDSGSPGARDSDRARRALIRSGRRVASFDATARFTVSRQTGSATYAEIDAIDKLISDYAVGFSIGTPTTLPYSVHEPS